MHFTEELFEQAVIELLEKMGYTHIYAPDINREDFSSPFLESTLLDSLVRINKKLPIEAINEAIYKLKNFENGSLVQKNKAFMNYLQNGVEVKYFSKARINGWHSWKQEKSQGRFHWWRWAAAFPGHRVGVPKSLRKFVCYDPLSDI